MLLISVVKFINFLVLYLMFFVGGEVVGMYYLFRKKVQFKKVEEEEEEDFEFFEVVEEVYENWDEEEFGEDWEEEEEWDEDWEDEEDWDEDWEEDEDDY